MRKIYLRNPNNPTYQKNQIILTNQINQNNLNSHLMNIQMIVNIAPMIMISIIVNLRMKRLNKMKNRTANKNTTMNWLLILL